MIRMAGERQTLTGDDEAAPGLVKTTDPLLSIIELLRSRAVAGVVVDSLGLQLVSWTPEFSFEELTRVTVDPRAAGDSSELVFRENDVKASAASGRSIAPYGQLRQPWRGPVRGPVTSQPPDRHPRHPVP